QVGVHVVRVPRVVQRDDDADDRDGEGNEREDHTGDPAYERDRTDHGRRGGEGQRGQAGQQEVVDAGAFELAVQHGGVRVVRPLLGGFDLEVQVVVLDVRLFLDQPALHAVVFDLGLGGADEVGRQDEVDAVVRVETVQEGLVAR